MESMESTATAPHLTEVMEAAIADFPRLHDWLWRPDPTAVDAATLRLMAVHAHPDDEASKGAATVAKYTALGVRASLVTCTGGEEGEILNKALQSPEVEADLAHVRMEELAESVDVCGYEVAYLLGYRDSGMAESPSNRHPGSFAQADFDEAVHRLVEIIRAERPHVVLGYDEHRFYPHPDHVMAHRITLAAYDAVGDPGYAAEGEAWAPQKLYWFHWSLERIMRMHDEFEARGWESPFSRWLENLEERREVATATAVTTRLDVTAQLPVARRALLAHRTQVDPDGFWLRLPDDVMAKIWPYEEYVLVRDSTSRDPGPAPDGEMEADLFAGM